MLCFGLCRYGLLCLSEVCGIIIVFRFVGCMWGVGSCFVVCLDFVVYCYIGCALLCCIDCVLGGIMLCCIMLCCR